MIHAYIQTITFLDRLHLWGSKEAIDRFYNLVTLGNAANSIILKKVMRPEPWELAVGEEDGLKIHKNNSFQLRSKINNGLCCIRKKWNESSQ